MIYFPLLKSHHLWLFSVILRLLGLSRKTPLLLKDTVGYLSLFTIRLDVLSLLPCLKIFHHLHHLRHLLLLLSLPVLLLLCLHFTHPPRLISPSRSLSPNANMTPVTHPAPRRSARTSAPPKRLGNFVNSARAMAADSMDTPKTWRQPLRSPNKARWLKTADDEFALLLGMETWKLVPTPEKRKIIKSKWFSRSRGGLKSPSSS